MSLLFKVSKMKDGYRSVLTKLTAGLFTSLGSAHKDEPPAFNDANFLQAISHNKFTQRTNPFHVSSRPERSEVEGSAFPPLLNPKL